jgi:hypothetical protein
LGEAVLACDDRDSEPRWPNCPPLQQLSIESIEGRPVALGVGSAGTSHWSLSVEPVAEGFRWDWACRVKETPQWLGTVYQEQSAIELQPEPGSVLETAAGTARVRPAELPAHAGTACWCYRVGLSGDAGT